MANPPIIPGTPATAVTTLTVVYPGSSLEAINGAILAATANKQFVLFAPGQYNLAGTINLPVNSKIIGYGAMLYQTLGAPILNVPNGYAYVEGFDLSGDSSKVVTGVTGELLRSQFVNLEFWTFLTFGMDAKTQHTFVNGCNFGEAGPVNPNFQPIRFSFTGELSNNQVFIRRCQITNAKTAYAVELRGGSSAYIEDTIIEGNYNSAAPIGCFGMLKVLVSKCHFERNSGLVMIDAQKATIGGEDIGCKVVMLEHTYVQLGDASNTGLLSYGAACGGSAIGNWANLFNRPIVINGGSLQSDVGNFWESPG